MSNAFGGAIPIFRVANLQASLEFYTTALGFHTDCGGPGVFASVSRDRCHIFLSQGDQGHPGAWTWIGVEDADALAAELRGRGVAIRQEPTNFPWAYELQVADPDGNILRCGSEPKKEPFGMFLDMDGKLWPPQNG
jgi:catechol 2,3-dioxygenase-like lactoylglutathione lyase family enzyme